MALRTLRQRFLLPISVLCSNVFLYFAYIYYYTIWFTPQLAQPTYLLEAIKLDCQGLLNEDPKILNELKPWKYDYVQVEKDILRADDKCSAIKEKFHFPSNPFSEEEAEYPLSYGILVYKNIAQVLFMFSAFYHPQNEYCFAVSGGASESFKQLMGTIEECFENVIVMFRPNIVWGEFEIINSTYTCLEELTKIERETPWKYFQYLSGVDVPLRTNFEMVKLFKAMNNTINADVVPYETYRAKKKNLHGAPMTLYKSSLSTLIPRPAADYLVSSKTTSELLDFLNGTEIPDEGFWGTVAGNPDVFPIPGGYNASALIDYRNKYWVKNKKTVEKNRHLKIKRSYYMSRYQVWEKGCAGKYSSASCVFGVGDFASMVRQPHLVAHKMYIDFQPAAYFCALKKIRRRTFAQDVFDTTIYRELPQVELKKGIPFEYMTHPEWLLS